MSSKKEDHPLSKAFSADMTAEKLAKAREDVRKEVDSKTPKPAEEEPEDTEEEPEEAEGAEEAEDTEEAADTEEDEGVESPDSQAGPAEYVVDLRNVADVLVILVGKYSQLIKLLYACIALLVIGVGLIVKAGFEINGLQVSQAGLQEEMRLAKEEVAEAKDEIKATKTAVEETKTEVKEAAEAAPKIQVDPDSGTAKVILKCKGDPKDCEKWSKKPKAPKKDGSKKPSTDKPPAAGKPAPPATGQIMVPLDPEVGLDKKGGY